MRGTGGLCTASTRRPARHFGRARSRKFASENATPPNGPATPTPTTDGEQRFRLLPDVGVLCYSAAGTEKWRVDLQPFHSMHGIASSLIVVDGLVIVVADQLAGSYVAAFKAETGKHGLEAERVDGVFGGYSTPSVYRAADGAARLVIPGRWKSSATSGDGQAIVVDRRHLE